MDVFAIASALRRNAAITVIVVVLTAAAAAVLLLLVPREYESQASYVLVNPVAAPTEAEIEADPSLAQVNRNNPYLRFSNQATVGQVLAGRVGGDAVRESLVARGADRAYTIAPSADYGGSGQVIDIVGTGTSPQEAQTTLELVQAAMTQQLQDMQTVYGASADSLITVLPVAEPTGARVVLSGLVRSLVGLVGAGVVLLFAAISVAEARRSRRSATGASATVDRSSAGVPGGGQENGSAAELLTGTGDQPPIRMLEEEVPVAATPEMRDRAHGVDPVAEVETSPAATSADASTRQRGRKGHNRKTDLTARQRRGNSGSSRRVF